MRWRSPHIATILILLSSSFFYFFFNKKTHSTSKATAKVITTPQECMEACDKHNMCNTWIMWCVDFMSGSGAVGARGERDGREKGEAPPRCRRGHLPTTLFSSHLIPFASPSFSTPSNSTTGCGTGCSLHLADAPNPLMKKQGVFAKSVAATHCVADGDKFPSGQCTLKMVADPAAPPVNSDDATWVGGTIAKKAKGPAARKEEKEAAAVAVVAPAPMDAAPAPAPAAAPAASMTTAPPATTAPPPTTATPAATAAAAVPATTVTPTPIEALAAAPAKAAGAIKDAGATTVAVTKDAGTTTVGVVTDAATTVAAAVKPPTAAP